MRVICFDIGYFRYLFRDSIKAAEVERSGDVDVAGRIHGDGGGVVLLSSAWCWALGVLLDPCLQASDVRDGRQLIAIRPTDKLVLVAEVSPILFSCRYLHIGLESLSDLITPTNMWDCFSVIRGDSIRIKFPFFTHFLVFCCFTLNSHEVICSCQYYWSPQSQLINHVNINLIEWKNTKFYLLAKITGITEF